MAGNPLLTGNTFDFFFLGADANRDKKVDLTDFTILAANFNSTGKTFSQGNFDYDPAGNVDLVDFTLLAARFNKTLPAAAAAQPLARLAPAPAPAAIAALPASQSSPFSVTLVASGDPTPDAPSVLDALLI